MKIEDINNYNSEKFIDSFKNIYEESKFITEHADKKRPFKNKKEMILIFLELFDNLDEETKINIIKKHPDLADKINSLCFNDKTSALTIRATPIHELTPITTITLIIFGSSKT